MSVSFFFEFVYLLFKIQSIMANATLEKPVENGVESHINGNEFLFFDF